MTPRSNTHVDITLDDITLDGTLDVPADATGIVVFAHSSGSTRHGAQTIDAELLRSHGLGTLLFDLLTVSEDQNQANQFDIDLLTSRLVGAVDWLRTQEATRGQAIGLCGSNTGAAAALRAAAAMDGKINAVVSRGGRVEMASDQLAAVESPTLLIVDETDWEMLERNRTAYEHLDCRKELYTIPGGGQSVANEDALEAVASVAAEWFADECQ